jgi:hypothetical protein
MGRTAKSVAGLVAILAVLVIGARLAPIREGTRSVTVATRNGNTTADVTRNVRSARAAAVKRCKDPVGLLQQVLGIQGPRHVVVREVTPSTGTHSFTVDCDTAKVTRLSP